MILSNSLFQMNISEWRTAHFRRLWSPKRQGRSAWKSAVARKEALQAAAVTENDELFELLRRLRKEIAAEQGVPPFVVFSDQTLKEMSAKLPKTDQDLLSVKGSGNKKIEIRSGF